MEIIDEEYDIIYVVIVNRFKFIDEKFIEKVVMFIYFGLVN